MNDIQGLKFARLDSRLTSITIVLSGLLILQLVLALWLNLSEKRYQPVVTNVPFFNCDWKDIDKVVITASDADGKESGSIALSKKRNAWVLGDTFDFPANRIRMEDLLRNLQDLKKGFPVSTTADAVNRFKVGDNKYLRRVQLFKDGKVRQTMYLGSSNAYHTVYVRNGDSTNVYAVDFSPYQLDTGLANWMDRTLTSFPLPKVVFLDMGSYQLKKAGREWSLLADGKEEKIAPEAASWMIDQLSRMAVLSVLGTKDDPAYDSEHTFLSYTVGLDDSSRTSFKISKPPDKDYCIAKLSSQPFYVKVDYTLVKQAKGITPDDIRRQDALVKQRAEHMKQQQEAAARQSQAAAQTDAPTHNKP